MEGKLKQVAKIEAIVYETQDKAHHPAAVKIDGDGPCVLYGVAMILQSLASKWGVSMVDVALYLESKLERWGGTTIDLNGIKRAEGDHE